MASDKRCGYCRVAGHNIAKCDVLIKQKELISTIIPYEKKAIHDTLLKNGVGVGAIVKVYMWHTSKYEECIIPSLKIFLDVDNMLEFRKVKYQKSTASTIRRVSTRENPYNPGGLMRYGVITNFSVPVYCLSDMSETASAPFSFGKFEHKPDALQNHHPDYWEASRHTEVLVPSQDTDTQDSDFLHDILVSERLLSSRRLKATKTW